MVTKSIRYNDGDTILDVGGNVGLFLHFAADQAKGLKIYSCEPIPATFELLTRNAAALLRQRTSMQIELIQHCRDRQDWKDDISVQTKISLCFDQSN